MRGNNDSGAQIHDASPTHHTAAKLAGLENSEKNGKRRIFVVLETLAEALTFKIEENFVDFEKLLGRGFLERQCPRTKRTRTTFRRCREREHVLSFMSANADG